MARNGFWFPLFLSKRLQHSGRAIANSWARPTRDDGQVRLDAGRCGLMEASSRRDGLRPAGERASLLSMVAACATLGALRRWCFSLPARPGPARSDADASASRRVPPSPDKYQDYSNERASGKPSRGESLVMMRVQRQQEHRRQAISSSCSFSAACSRYLNSSGK